MNKIKTVKHSLGLGALAALALVSTASAEVEHFRSTVRGKAVTAAWYHVDDCRATGVSLWAFDEFDRGNAGQPVYAQQVEVYVWHMDFCTGKAFDAFGSANAVLDIDGLDLATVEVPVQITGWMCVPMPDGTLSCGDDELETGTFSVTFTGTGDVTNERSNSIFEQGTTRVIDRYNSSHRWAEVTGTLVLADTELLGELMDAELYDIRHGTHVVTKY